MLFIEIDAFQKHSFVGWLLFSIFKPANSPVLMMQQNNEDSTPIM